jgi:hypothetical protein
MARARCERNWSYHSEILAMLHNVNRAAGARAATAADYNPFKQDQAKSNEPDLQLTKREFVLTLARAVCKNQNIPDA